MEERIIYRGRTISTEDITFLRDLIVRHPEASRRKLSALVCEAWDWRQANGALRDMVCRSMMLMLHRGGQIELPARKQNPRNPLAERRQPATDLLIDESPVNGPLQELQPLVIRQVRRTSSEPLFNSLIERDHYLGYIQPVGEHLKYMAFAQDRPVACLGWSSAPWHIGPRDRFIGWSPTVRRGNLNLIACNTRFLIPDWVRVPHLASHLLGRMARQISADWQEVYGHPIHYLETFVDRERFLGTCYRAANWIHLGQTTGRWRRDKKGQADCHRKDVLGYPLGKRFRQKLCESSLCAAPTIEEAL
jgi:hypothetical protein